MRPSFSPLPSLAAAAAMSLLLASCGAVGGAKNLASSLSNEPKGSDDDVASSEEKKGFRVPSNGIDDSEKIKAKFGAVQKSYNANGQNKKAAGFDHEDPNFSNKAFASKEVKNKSFWGDKEYATKVYGGNTDGSRFMKNSIFGSKNAREGGQAANDANRHFAVHDFDGGNKAAREASKSGVDARSDSQVDFRRKVGNAFSDPDVMSWKEQRSMNVGDVKSLMGR